MSGVAVPLWSRASAKQNGNVIPSSSLFLLDNWHMYTPTGVYSACFFILDLVVLCEISSSGEVRAEGVGMFVLLTLLVKFVIVLQRLLFYKMYFKRRLARICHEATSAKAALKKKTKVSSRAVLVF